MNTILDSYAESCAGVFGTPKAALVRGSGCEVWDEQGRRYLDLLGGIAVNALGHAHPRWVAAVTEQAGKLAHVSNFFATGPQVQLAQKLLRLAELPPGSAVFLANSGTEANEAAFKLARRHGAENPLPAGHPQAGVPRTEIIAFEGAFHGRTMGALALTAKEAYRQPFAPLPDGVRHIPFDDLTALEQITEATAAVVVEPIQGEAGVRVPSPGYLAALRRRTREVGAVLIADEVQTGIGRTGAWLASAAEQLEPDAITLAKGLGGGFPIGALLTRGPEVSALLQAGQHGTTFGGNPLAARAALETLAVIEEEGLLENARARGQQLRAGLAQTEGIFAVRGEGLLIAADLAPGLSAPAAVEAAQQAGFLINATGPSTLRLAPPLILSEPQAASFLEALPAVLASSEEAQQAE